MLYLLLDHVNHSQVILMEKLKLLEEERQRRIDAITFYTPTVPVIGMNSDNVRPARASCDVIPTLAEMDGDRLGLAEDNEEDDDDERDQEEDDDDEDDDDEDSEFVGELEDSTASSFVERV